MSNEQKYSFALGLAQKAGKVVSGDFQVKAALKSGKIKLMLIATDTAEKTKKEFIYLATTYKVETLEVLNKQQLGWAIGKAPRACIGIIDKNFVKMLK